MVAWNRPEYTRRVLEGLATCRGVEKYTLTVSLEPGCPEVEALFHQTWPFCVAYGVHPVRKGVALNTKYVIGSLFGQGAERIIHLEDDTVPAPGALEYFEWAFEKYKHDHSILSISAYYYAGQHQCIDQDNLGKSVPREHWHAVRRRQWFTPWMWGTWKDRWRDMESQWVNVTHINDSWATHINHHVRGDRYEIIPALARSQNIGAENGVHVVDPAWHKQHHFNEEWEGKYTVPHGTFFELPPKPAPVQD